MRKEVLVAIFIGIVLGAAVAFGIWRANSYLSPKSADQNKTEEITSPKPSEDPTFTTSGLAITEPENNSVIATESVTIKGSTNPNSTVVVTSNSNESIVEAGTDGSFAAEVALDGGPNQINVVSYDKDGNEDKQSLVVVYSTEFAEQ